MQTSRFQLGLIATLAVSLGFSLSSANAIGYPAGTVSSGTNPIWSVGGQVDGSTSVVLDLDIPEGQVAVVSDLVFSVVDVAVNCPGHVKFSLDTAAGRLASMAVEVSSWKTQHEALTYRAYGWATGTSTGPSVLPVHFNSGVRIDADETLTLHTQELKPCTGSTSIYTVSGYYAQS